MPADITYCVVNTNGREHLLACLDAIARTHPEGLEPELLILDNASNDGSAAAARAWAQTLTCHSERRGREAAPEPRNLVPAASASEIGERTRVIARQTRAGKAENDSILLREASAPYCLLLNEDAELRDGAAQALFDALLSNRRAGAAGAQLIDPAGRRQPCAWRLPGLFTAIAGALFLHRLFTVQSGGRRIRRVGWAQSSALLVRRDAAEQVGYLDPDFFVYSDETDFCKRLRDAGWRTLYVPRAEALHHEQLATDNRAGARRIVEFHRGRDRYMRKHHSRAVAAMARVLGAWPYLPRAFAAIFLPGHDRRRYLFHARQALRPWQGVGLREAAEEYNKGTSSGYRGRPEPAPVTSRGVDP